VPGSDATAQPPAPAAPAAAPQRPVLRVATSEAPPFVLRHGDAPTGFSIDVWNAVAQRLGAQTRFLATKTRAAAAKVQSRHAEPRHIRAVPSRAAAPTGVAGDAPQRSYLPIRRAISAATAALRLRTC